MAPMIDMVFLLLVFFMCVSSLSQADRRVELDLAESETSSIPEDLADRIPLSLTADGTLYVGARPTSLEEMGDRLEQSLRQTPDLRVNLRADEQTPYREIRAVLSACAETGVHDVIYATYQSQ